MSGLGASVRPRAGFRRPGARRPSGASCSASEGEPGTECRKDASCSEWILVVASGYSDQHVHHQELQPKGDFLLLDAQVEHLVPSGHRQASVGTFLG